MLLIEEAGQNNMLTLSVIKKIESLCCASSQTPKKLRKEYMKPINYLKTFFKEKNIPYTQFEIEFKGVTHFIDSDLVIDLIYQCQETEMNKIILILRKADIQNVPISNILKELGRSFIAHNYK